MDDGFLGIRTDQVGISYHQQVSAAVLHEITRAPRFQVPEPLDQIDHVTLVAETFLYSIAQVGIGGHAIDYALVGATKENLICYMAERAKAQIAFFGLGLVPDTIVTAFCMRLLDQLMRHGTFAEKRGVSLFGCEKPLRFDLFRERYAANGRDVVVIASEYATNAIFQCLSNDITDIVAANQFMIRHQLERKEYGRMATYLQQQLRIAQSFRAEVIQLLNRVRYEIRSTRWGDHLANTVERVRKQADEVIDQDLHIRNGLHIALQEADKADRDKIVCLETLGSTAFSRHAAINGEVIRLHEEFLENKSIRGMRPPGGSLIHDHEAEILRPLLQADVDAIVESQLGFLDLLQLPVLPTSSDPVLWLRCLLDRRRADDQESEEDEFSEFEEGEDIFDESRDVERLELELDDNLLDYAHEIGGPFTLSEFLVALERRGMPEAKLHVACLFVSTIYLHGSKRYSVNRAPPHSEAVGARANFPALDSKGFVTDDDGNRMEFACKKEAGLWLACHRLSGFAELAVVVANSERTWVRATAAYPNVWDTDDGREFVAGSLYGTNYLIELLDANEDNYVRPPPRP